MRMALFHALALQLPGARWAIHNTSEVKVPAFSEMAVWLSVPSHLDGEVVLLTPVEKRDDRESEHLRGLSLVAAGETWREDGGWALRGAEWLRRALTSQRDMCYRHDLGICGARQQVQPGAPASDVSGAG